MNKRYNPQLMLEGFTLADMEKEAIAYLQLNEPPDGYEVGFSGGKDSIVTLDLVRRSGVKHHAHFSMSYIDPPEVLSFIRYHYPDVEWRRPKVNIYHAILTNGLPSPKYRWCCDLIKEKVPDPHVVVGIRAEESIRRASYPRTDNIKKHKKRLYKPIFNWKEWAVWEYIDKYHLLYPSLYEEFDRLGCVVCPLAFSPSPHARLRQEKSMKRYPGIWRAYKDAAKKHFEMHKDYRIKFKTFEELWDAFLIGFRGGNQ